MRQAVPYLGGTMMRHAPYIAAPFECSFVRVIEKRSVDAEAMPLSIFTYGGTNDMSQSSVSVWATSDGVRVNPETGRYLEARPDIHADYPGGEYQARNAVWDDVAGRVSLHAGRNEFVAFQVIVAVEEPVSDIGICFDALRGPDGEEISGRNQQ